MATRARFLYNNYITAESMLAVSSLRSGIVSSANKEGTGSASITTSGNYSGTTDLEYVIRIDSLGTGEIGSSTFKWSDDGGLTWDATGVFTSHTATLLNNGVYICWPLHGVGADFVMDDTWYFRGVNPFNPGKMINYDRDCRFRSGHLDAPNTVTISLGSALEGQAIAILDHNFSSGATITLEFDSSTAFTGGNYHVETIPWASGKILYYIGSSDATHTTAIRTRQYWRLNVTDAANPNGFIEIGELFLGTYLELSRNFITGYKRDLNLIAEINKTPYGVGRSHFYNTQYMFSYEFRNLLEADITSMNTLVSSTTSRTTGVRKFFYFNKDSADVASFWPVIISSLSVTNQDTYLYFSMALEMEEVLTSV